MAKPLSTKARSPQAGDVIAFEYLWKHESQAGLVNGVKTRHCVIVRVSESGLVAVMPITGTQPTHGNTVQLQGGVLGLARASWIVTSEINVTIWPGHDLRRADPSQGAWWRYGQLTQARRDALADDLQDGLKRGRIAIVKR